MKILKLISGFAAILLLGTFAWIFYAPALLIKLSEKLSLIILKLSCWSKGTHSYNIFSSLVIRDIKDLRCMDCQSLISEKDIPSILAQREQFAATIQFLNKNVEQEQITDELSKLNV